MRSLTHNGSDKVSKQDIILECREISERLQKECSDGDKEKLMSLLEQLSEFELGRFLIKNKGAFSGYWTYYMILGFTESKTLHPLEQAILTTAPGVLATRERFHIFQSELQRCIQSNAVVCSIPCGVMADLLTLQIPDGVENVRFVGIDLDQASLDLAARMAERNNKSALCQFFQQDAWHLNRHAEFDMITTNGLNIYEADDEKVTDLYRQLCVALKPNGKLIGSALSCPPGGAKKSEWDMSKINVEALQLQRAVFLQILQATWSHFRTSDETISQLKKAGFGSVHITWDERKLFYTFQATKP